MAKSLQVSLSKAVYITQHLVSSITYRYVDLTSARWTTSILRQTSEIDIQLVQSRRMSRCLTNLSISVLIHITI